LAKDNSTRMTSRKQETAPHLGKSSLQMEEEAKPNRVVIIRAGIAGLAAARELVTRGYVL
jgi:NADPH-dependent 2,4-dienoyl-CoA reductase/sulfur reductase-like enzyme